LSRKSFVWGAGRYKTSFQRLLCSVFLLGLPYTAWLIFQSLVQIGFFHIKPIHFILEGEANQSLAKESAQDLNQSISKDVTQSFGKISTQKVVYESSMDAVYKMFKPLEGVNIWDIQTDAVAKKLWKLPWVKNFSIFKKWPNEIEVRIEVAPVLFIHYNKKQYRLFFEGYKWGGFLDSKKPELDKPLLVTESKNISDDIVTTTVYLLELLQKQKYLSVKNLEHIFWSPKKGYILQLKQPQTEVLLGFLDDGLDESKLNRVTHVLDYLDQHKIEARVIDSNFTKKVVVRLRNQF
jgi:hypothetical protein